MSGNAEHLKEYQFKEGNPGGPGRPKGTGIRKLVKEIVEEPASRRRTKADWVARKLVHRAMKGNLFAIGMVLDNVDGRLPQQVSQTEPFIVKFIIGEDGKDNQTEPDATEIHIKP